MTDLSYPIWYLEIQDFDAAGNFIGDQLRDKPLMIMLQTSWCGHCAAAKPEFQKLAETGIVNCATIQADGERQSEKDLGKIVPDIYPEAFKGFPSYMLILPSGRKVVHNGGRDVNSLEKFVLSQL